MIESLKTQNAANIASLADAKISILALEKAKKAKKAKAGFSDAEKATLEENSAIAIDLFRRYNIVKRVAVADEKLRKQFLNFYFKYQSELVELRKASKLDGSVENQTAKKLAKNLAIKALKTMYPERSFAEKSIKDLLIDLNKARSAKRKAQNKILIGSKVENGTVIYRAVDNTDNDKFIDFMSVTESPVTEGIIKKEIMVHGFGRVKTDSISETVDCISKVVSLKVLEMVDIRTKTEETKTEETK